MEAALEHLLRSPVALAVVTRGTGRVVVVNRAFTELTGHAERDLVGRVVPVSIVGTRALVHGGESSFTDITLATRADGIVTRVVVSVAPLRDGAEEPRHCIVLLREVHGDREAFECESA